MLLDCDRLYCQYHIQLNMTRNPHIQHNLVNSFQPSHQCLCCTQAFSLAAHCLSCFCIQKQFMHTPAEFDTLVPVWYPTPGLTFSLFPIILYLQLLSSSMICCECIKQISAYRITSGENTRMCMQLLYVFSWPPCMKILNPYIACNIFALQSHSRFQLSTCTVYNRYRHASKHCAIDTLKRFGLPVMIKFAMATIPPKLKAENVN